MKKVFNYIKNILLTIVLVICISFLGLRAFGIQSSVVMSGSMEPTLPTGSVVFVDYRYDYNKLKIGDIAVFSANEGMDVIHRIVEQKPEGFITKGDNNDVQDGLTVTPSTFKGKELFHIPFVGYGIKMMMKYHINIIIIGLVIFYFIYQFVFTYLIKAEDE